MIIRRSPVFLPILLAGTLGGCGGNSSRLDVDVRVDTLPNGAVHVRSPERGTWREEERWRLVEEVRIGRMEGDGPDVFGSVGGLAADAAGRIYVGDAQAAEVRIFAADGRHLRTLGRRGAGPGEFQQISGMNWDPDGRLWIMDARNYRFTVIEPEAGFVENRGRDRGFAMVPWPGRIDNAGIVHDVALIGSSPLESSTAIVRYAPPQLTAIDTFLLPPYEPSRFQIVDAEGRRFVSAIVPFSASLLWSIAPDGDIWFGTSDRYRIHRLARSGDTLRIVERTQTPVGVSPTERAASIEGLEWFTAQGGQVDASRIPSVKPAFGAFFEDDSGYLWVRATVDENSTPRFDIFDPLGRYLGGVDAPPGISAMPAPVVRGDRLYAALRDDLEVESVASFRIEGRVD